MSRIISIGKQDFVSLRKNHYFILIKQNNYKDAVQKIKILLWMFIDKTAI